MNTKEREVFWETLRSLPGENPDLDAKALSDVIKPPHFLYRYRSVNSKNLEALRSNRLFFSSANYYDDPFDTFLYIDVEAIKNEVLSGVQDEGNLKTVIEKAKETFQNTISEEQLSTITVENIRNSVANGMLDKFLNQTLQLRNELKKDTWSVCFSENGLNEALWLKYAQQHKGFVVIYDLTNADNMLCGKQDKCVNCGIFNYGTPLYPIYYSDVPYDATRFAKSLMMHKLEEFSGTPFPDRDKIYADAVWERERITLIKKKCHEYDEEWRIIAGCQMNPPIMREWIPHGIILGLKMDISEENLVICLAKQAGIKNIYKAYIDAGNKLNIVPVTTV